jgi:hypothetical protein
MQTVRDGDGRRYLLVKRSSDAWLVRDPETGDERYLPGDSLEPVDESPLEAAARAVPDDGEPTGGPRASSGERSESDGVRRVATTVPSRRGLGLLVELDRRGPTSVRDLLGDYDLCESDLHGLLASYAAAGLVEETAVAGDRGYRLTDAGERGLAALTG